jgi:CheY-like chemotaxis protein
VKRVLIADDEEMLRNAFAEALREEGYAVVVAVDGQAALDRLRTEPPDLVLMDVMMPRLGGDAAYRAMRASDDLPAVPVVLMSAAVAEPDLDRSIAGYLAKPFELDDLLGLVERLIGPPA